MNKFNKKTKINIENFITEFYSLIDLNKFDAFDRKAVNGDLGDLIGIEFNSDKFGGYIDFWSNGFLAFQLLNYESGNDIVEDTLLEWKDQDIEEMLSNLVNKFKEVNGRFS